MHFLKADVMFSVFASCSFSHIPAFKGGLKMIDVYGKDLGTHYMRQTHERIGRHQQPSTVILIHGLAWIIGASLVNYV